MFPGASAHARQGHLSCARDIPLVELPAVIEKLEPAPRPIFYV
jgi:hypothetical protein